MELDFSQYHPLDHRPGSRRCRTFYGGWRHHLSLAWWEGGVRDRVHRPLYKVLLCPLGRHAEEVWYTRKPDGGMRVIPTCKHCDWTRLPSENDVERGMQLRWLGKGND